MTYDEIKNLLVENFCRCYKMLVSCNSGRQLKNQWRCENEISQDQKYPAERLHG